MLSGLFLMIKESVGLDFSDDLNDRMVGWS